MLDEAEFAVGGNDASLLDGVFVGFLDEEVDHLAKGFVVECHRAVSAARNTDKFFQTSCFLQGFGEIHALAVGYDVVGIAVDDEEAWAFLGNVGDGADKCHHVGVVGWCTADEGCFGRLCVFHCLAVFHPCHIDRTEPIDNGIHMAALVEVAADGAFEVNGGFADFACLHAASDSCQ